MRAVLPKEGSGYWSLNTYPRGGTETVKRDPRGMGEGSFFLAAVPKAPAAMFFWPGLRVAKDGAAGVGGIPQCDQVEFIWLEKT